MSERGRYVTVIDEQGKTTRIKASPGCHFCSVHVCMCPCTPCCKKNGYKKLPSNDNEDGEEEEQPEEEEGQEEAGEQEKQQQEEEEKRQRLQDQAASRQQKERLEQQRQQRQQQQQKTPTPKPKPTVPKIVNKPTPKVKEVVSKRDDDYREKEEGTAGCCGMLKSNKDASSKEEERRMFNTSWPAPTPFGQQPTYAPPRKNRLVNFSTKASRSAPRFYTPDAQKPLQGALYHMPSQPQPQQPTNNNNNFTAKKTDVSPSLTYNPTLNYGKAKTVRGPPPPRPIRPAPVDPKYKITRTAPLPPRNDRPAVTQNTFVKPPPPAPPPPPVAKAPQNRPQHFGTGAYTGAASNPAPKPHFGRVDGWKVNGNQRT